MPRRKRLIVAIAIGAAGVCVVGLLVVSGFDQSATPEIAGATATTVSDKPTTSNTVTTVTSTTDRLAQQERPSTAGGDIVSNAVGGEAETPNDPAGPETLPTTPPLLPPIEVPLDWDGEPVEFRVLAVNSLQDGFAVVDLADRSMRVYLLGHHDLPLGSIGVAAFTRQGDVLVHQSGEHDTYVVPDGNFSATPSVINPSERIIETEYETFTHYADMQALGDRSGEKVWLLQRTPSDTTLVDLVSIDNGTAMLTVALDGSYWIAGLSEEGLFLVSERDDLVISPSGTVRDLSTCRDDPARDRYLVAVFGNHTTCRTDDSRQLVFYDGSTGQEDVNIAFESGRWLGTFLPEIPAVNITGVHADQLLLRLQIPDVDNLPYDKTKAVYVADLSEHTVQLVHEYEDGRHGSPLGFVDGVLIVKAGVEGENSIVLVDVASGVWHKVVDLPEGYFVYDAK